MDLARTLPNQERLQAMQSFCHAEEWLKVEESGDALNWMAVSGASPQTPEHFNRSQRQGLEPMPWLAGLICLSLFDIALHDAFGHCNYLPPMSAIPPASQLHLSRYLQRALHSLTPHSLNLSCGFSKRRSHPRCMAFGRRPGPT